MLNQRYELTAHPAADPNSGARYYRLDVVDLVGQRLDVPRSLMCMRGSTHAAGQGIHPISRARLRGEPLVGLAPRSHEK